MDSGLHHAHRRKRIHQKHEKYPHPNKWKRRMDKAIYIVGILGPIMTLHQIYKIWFEQNAVGVSPVSWATYLIVACFWVAYGVLHKEKPIIFIFGFWIILDILIVIGTLIYG